LLWAAGGLAALWIAVAGGEYSSFDILRQRQQRQRLVREIDSLTRITDSLTAHKQRVLTDPRTQERIAREEFGMVRGKELLYRIAEPADPPTTKSP
jgi:cell division protein FtsB